MDELIKRLRNRRICIQQSGSLDDFPLLREAADAIEELQKPKWISVEERLPKEDEAVLTWGKHKTHLLDWLHDGRWCCFGEVTHWMPLPEPPNCGAKMEAGE